MWMRMLALVSFGKNNPPTRKSDCITIMDTKNYTSQTPYHFDEGDDGSLSALGIDTDRDRKTFNCKAIRQTDLIDK